MADAVTSFSTLSNDAPNVWIAQEMYSLMEKRLVVGSYAKKYNLPQRMGTSLRIVRYKRLNLPTGTLTEGTPPDAVALATENVDVTVEQWGIVALLTDVAQITTKHPALRIAIDRTGLAMAETLEREMSEMLLAGTNIFYGAAAANRAALDGTKDIATTDILAALANLRTSGAPEWSGGLFGGVMHPNQEADLLGADTTFKDLSAYANVKRFDFGQIGVWMGVNWRRSNFLPVYRGITAPGTQTAEDSGSTDAGSGSLYNSSNIWVVSRDITTDYERKVSQAYTTGGTADSCDILTPTSTNYVYDIYSDGDGGGGTVKLISSRLVAGTTKTVDPAAYTAGSVASYPTIPADDKEVFIAWVFGQDSFGRVELNGMSLQSYITPAGASYSNPLAQGRKVGSKIMWKSFLIDGNYMARLETNASYSAALPA